MVRIFCIIGAIIAMSCSSNFETKNYKLTKTKNTVTIINAKKGTGYKLTPIAQEIVKVVFLHDSTTTEEKSYLTSLKDIKYPDYSIKEKPDKVIISTNELIIEITKKPFVVNAYDNEGNKLIISNREPLVENNKKTLFFASDKNESFYGMGQKSIPVNRRGYAFDVYNRHIGGYTKEYANMQVNIPYVYTSNGYGVFIDNTYTGYVDLASNREDEWSYQVDGGTLTYYLVKGENLQELQTSYYGLTGYPTMPPKFTLGLMQSKCGYKSDKEVYDVIQQFEKYNLPLDAIILDAYWFGGYGNDYPKLMGNFTFYKKNFPDPEGYMAKLKAKGIKTILINEPQINHNSENYDYLASKGYLVAKKGDSIPFINESYWAGEASLLDLSHPGAQEWLWGKLKANVELGIDGFWVDLTEPDVPVENGEYYIGSDKKVHNIYSFLFAKIIWDGFQKDYPNRRVYNITRAGTAGMQRFGAVHWSGDASKTYKSFEYQIPMTIGAAMSGMPHYSSDIGGFTNAWDTISVPWNEYKGGPAITSPGLYTRWFQFGVFSPALRPHSGEGQACEPFAFNKEVLAITKNYLDLRYKLIPYLYTYAHKTATTGEQLIKPLFMEYTGPIVDTMNRQYLFGEMLVAPVFEPDQTSKNVYLPSGTKWYNFFTNETYEGGEMYSVAAPLDVIPVFVPEGAIIPLGKIKQYMDESPDDTLTLKVYAGKDGAFTLYEDDGETYDYENGEYATTRIIVEDNKNELHIAIFPIEGNYNGILSERTWKLEIIGLDNVKSFAINGKPARYKKKGKTIKTLISNKTSQKTKLSIRH